MSTAATAQILLLAVDGAIAAMKVATAYNELIQSAQIEGRELTMDDLDAIDADNAVKRDAWNEARDQVLVGN